MATIQIPIIDISSPSDEVAAELLVAASSFGFVFIKNNETVVSNQSIADMFQLVLTWGRRRRAFNIGEYLGCKAQQTLPPMLQANEERIGLFFESCHRVCTDVLNLIAVALRIDPHAGGKDWFSSRHDRALGPSGSILRILHYPALPEAMDYDPEVDIRAGAHSDYGSVTLLFQMPGQPGLEILTSEGTWLPVPVNPGDETVLPILLNIGTCSPTGPAACSNPRFTE